MMCGDSIGYEKADRDDKFDTEANILYEDYIDAI